VLSIGTKINYLGRLERPNALMQKKSSYRAHQKHLNEAGTLAAICGAMSLVSRNVRFVQIFAGIP